MGLLNQFDKAPMAEAVEEEANVPEQGLAAPQNLVGNQSAAATPTEQKELETAIERLLVLLYENKQTSGAIMNMLKSSPKDPRVAVYNATMLAIRQVDKEIDVSEAVLVELIPTVIDMLVELGTESGTFAMNDDELKNTVTYVTMGVMEEYGLDQEGGEQYVNGMSEQQKSELVTMMGSMK